MDKKLTKMIALEIALSAIDGNAIKEYSYTVGDETIVFTADEAKVKLNEMWKQLYKKSKAEKPKTENQKQNEGFKTDILNILADKQVRTATEILNAGTTFPDSMTNQRISAILRLMKDEGTIIKETVKGKSLFKIAE